MNWKALGEWLNKPAFYMEWETPDEPVEMKRVQHIEEQPKRLQQTKRKEIEAQWKLLE